MAMAMAINKPPHDDDNKTCCCLCLLPSDVLKFILSYLSVLDYINFRVVCKCWRLAFSDCASSAGILSQEYPQPQSELPWCLVLKAVSSEQCLLYPPRPILHTTGELLSLSADRMYKTDIEELSRSGSRILLSKFGWLLLFTCSSDQEQGSEIYFFNPFSKAKVVLPYVNVSNLLCPIFDISAPPTSPDCMVLVAICHEEFFYLNEIVNGNINVNKIGVCSRGDSSWTWYQGIYEGSINNSVLANGIWYLHHTSGIKFSKFDVLNRRCEAVDVRVEEGFYGIGRSRLISYPVKRGEKTFLRIHGYKCYEIELNNSEPTLVAKLVDPFNAEWNLEEDYTMPNLNLQDSEILFRTNLEEAIVQERGMVSIDSFNIDAWCAKLDAHYMTIRWHRCKSNRTILYHLHEQDICYTKNDCSTYLMWFEPVWVQPSPNLSW